MSVDPHQPLRDDVRLLGEVLGPCAAASRRRRDFRTGRAGARGRQEGAHARQRARAHRSAAARHADGVGADRRARVRAFSDARQHRRAAPPRASPARPRARSARPSAARIRCRDLCAAATGWRAGGRARRVDRSPCASSWSSPRIRPRSFAARCCRNTTASPQILALRDRPDLTPDEQEESLADLQREIAAAWQTDEVRRERVSPLDEVRAGLVVFEQSLWDALPQYLRAVDRALTAATGTPLAARRRADQIRIVDWRRSRRQSEHHRRK